MKHTTLPLKYSSPISLNIRSRGRIFFVAEHMAALVTISIQFLPFSRYQQEIRDVNQGEVRRGLSVKPHMQLIQKE
ncbi:hypothetical protein CWO05_07500 [Vibrio splendidus]|nr:hypothetical protein CWO05_07500 [Vibrio splendidus]